MVEEKFEVLRITLRAVLSALRYTGFLTLSRKKSENPKADRMEVAKWAIKVKERDD